MSANAQQHSNCFFFNSIITDTSDTLFLPSGHLYRSRGNLLVSSAPSCSSRVPVPASPAPLASKRIFWGIFCVDFLEQFEGFLLGAAGRAETSALGGMGETFPRCCLKIPAARGCSVWVPAWARSPRCLHRCRSIAGSVPSLVNSTPFRCHSSPEKAPSHWQWGSEMSPP